jgi:DNA-binding NarL/FixJ family response regulator
MKILLVERNPDDAALAREAILEIAESRRWRDWIRHADLVHLERIEDAIAVLAEEPFDVALVDAASPDSCGLAPLFLLRARAPELPVILLLSDADDLLGISAVREGAEDCIAKSELDCGLLARTMRNAIERRRRAAALRDVVLLDAETGLYNRTGFLIAGDRYRRLARRLKRSLSLVAVEAAGAGGSADTAPSAPEEIAEILCLSFPEGDVIARLQTCRFAVLSLGDGDGEEIPAALAAMRRRIFARNRRRRDGPPLGARVGTARLEPAQDLAIEELLGQAEAALCENGPSEPAAWSPARRASA